MMTNVGQSGQGRGVDGDDARTLVCLQQTRHVALRPGPNPPTT